MVDNMVQIDPALRPSIDKVQEEFAKLLKGLSRLKLRSRLRKPKESVDERVFRFVLHAFRTAGWLMKRRAAVPSPT